MRPRYVYPHVSLRETCRSRGGVGSALITTQTRKVIYYPAINIPTRNKARETANLARASARASVISSSYTLPRDRRGGVEVFIDSKIQVANYNPEEMGT